MPRIHPTQLVGSIIATIGLLTTIAFAQSATPATPATQPPKQTDVPVKIVVLFSSGVGYFEHIGPVTDNASTELRFKTAQINDILKSLVLQDTGGGKVGTVVYPSLDPIDKILRSFQVDITKNPPLADLLNQLRGAKVTVASSTEKIVGTILGVEKKPKAVEKGSIEVWQLNLLAGGTIRSVMLDDVNRIDLDDPQLQDELNKALAALAQARDQDKKPVTIQFNGQGQRLVRLGYVVETPVWKTSYRLLLGEKPSLQGWAIVENQTDNDWHDVQLSLVSGRPISFIEELYQPIYIPRPVVKPELYASLRPQTYEEGLAEREKLAGAPAAAPALARRSEAKAARDLAGEAGAFGRGGAAYGGIANQPIDAAASVASVASAARIGELFQYTVGNVSLPRQRSSMIPIITDPIEVERLSIYNLNVLARHPLNGARLKNTTSKHLLQGPITVLEGSSYAGDASIGNLPPGQERLISYGIDLQMVVNATKNTQTNSIIAGTIVKGVLHIKRRLVFNQDYIAENKDTKDKTLIVEHPFRQGWQLVDTSKPVETTETLYRFRETVPAGKQASLTVKEQLVTSEAIQILPMDISAMELYAKSGAIDQKVRDALTRAVSLKQRMTDLQREVAQRKVEMNQIAQDQARIRENLKTVPERSPLHSRLLEKMTEQEKQIDALYAKMDEQQKAFEAARKELEDYLSNLTIE